MIEIRKPFDRVRSPVNMSGQEDRCDRSFGNDTDVNKIVARFSRTGELPVQQGQPQYGDVTGLQRDLTEIIQRGKDAAAELHELQIQQDAEQQKQLEAQAERLAELEAKEKLSQETTEPE